ncbi:MAG TPA: hypothetical protein VL461_05380 [Dictyobacter sp.]|nr:hypothetical protein [Dictyobacter sp.]
MTDQPLTGLPEAGSLFVDRLSGSRGTGAANSPDKLSEVANGESAVPEEAGVQGAASSPDKLSEVANDESAVQGYRGQLAP